MGKKIVHKKQSIETKNTRHPDTLSKTVKYYLIRYVISVAIVALIFMGIHFFESAHPTYCANSTSCIHDLSLHIENNAVGIFEGRKVIPPKIDLAQAPFPFAVLGAQTMIGPKHIYVDLSTQTLYAFQGTTQIMQTLISSGKWHPTPVGNFTIWIKLQATRMSGGEGDDAYDLPNVPYTMFFSNDQVPASEGFSIHGAYWHNNFGHMMSHGCINMRTDDVKKLYEWADPATTGYTTYATKKNPGTEVSVCTAIQKKPGKFVCIQ